jgi:hypothetical protein
LRRPITQISGRVFAVPGVVFRMDAEDLAAQVVGVGGRALGVLVLAALSLVDRGVALAARVGVVTGREVEIAFAVEVHAAALMGVDIALGEELQQDLLVLDRVGELVERDPRQAVHRLGPR